MKCAATALFCLLFYPASLPAQSQKTLLLGLASISGGIETLYVTKKIGAFKRNGLDVDFLLLQGGSQALQVLLSGDIKLISGGGGTAAQRARFKGAGNLLVATYTPTMPYSLYVSSKIQDAKRLKGAKIAISRFGSSSDFAARFMVTRLGLDPSKDVTIMQIGNQRERMSALLSGSVEGSVVDAPNTLIARQQGFVELADASKLGLTYPHNNIATTDRFIREEPQTVFGFLRAFVEGIAYYRTHKAESIQMIKEFLRVSDNAIAEEAYEYYSRITPAKPYPTTEGVRGVLEEIALTEPAIKNAKLEQFVDPSFIAKLDQSGFIDGLYKKR
ncbi:MAG TPA: ABC transporter substrate-binding protein [Candidatus Saccharimonadales bacterium]|jgi:NitT/TauT family transport system substrate-binding protein|nr:ABC transporter substrate-binding protein [Candidatus Saccharimonadales bacterium]